jgi:hypothetical protein
MILSFNGEFRQLRGQVLSYATDMSDDGLLQATNQERQKEGLKPLTYNFLLDQAAQAKAEDMAAKNYWSHNTPDGKEPWVFIESASYKYHKAAENLAYGFDNSQTTLSGWMNSPSHRANVLDGDLRDVGFGIVNIPNYQGRGPETLVVAMYGDPPTSLFGGSPNNGTGPASLLPQNEKSISLAQAITGGAAPWITFVVGILLGASILHMSARHLKTLHRSVRRGERFIVHHPLLDLTIVAFIVLAAIVVQTAGVIQ